MPYVSFVKKDALISNLLKATMIDKETGNVKVNSSAEYLLKTRILIENYTNLTVETDGFYEAVSYTHLTDNNYVCRTLTFQVLDLNGIVNTPYGQETQIRNNEYWT